MRLNDYETTRQKSAFVRGEERIMTFSNARFLLVTLIAAFAWSGCGSPGGDSMTEDSGAASQDYLNESQEAFDARMEWWRNARFGMFIHWGP
ncbi:MAG: alpha-L-fucosidase, partial [Gemmatimonadetes bacterium]|nr:alpha-L-fucosidase [Gemmatimonadota bacterium]